MPQPDSNAAAQDVRPTGARLTHLERLEAESIHILREVVSEVEKPVMLYSVGKDSAVMLHLARKAFFPSKPPFPLLHVDTTWKFRDMYILRDRMARESCMELLVYQNPEAAAQGINPLKDVNRLLVGQDLIVPNPAVATTAPRAATGTPAGPGAGGGAATSTTEEPPPTEEEPEDPSVATASTLPAATKDG